MALEQVAPGDLVVGPGKVVPVDGWLVSEVAMFDESVLTGEPVHVQRREHARAAGTCELRRGPPTALTRVSCGSRAWFLLLALIVAGAARARSGSEVRAVSVRGGGAPCPLLLAAPVAMSRACPGLHAWV